MSGETGVILALGGFFILTGLVMLFIGSREEKGYYDALSGKRDLREFVTHNPERAEPGSVRTGGWIALAIGAVILIIGLLIT
ncbi:MAG: hypothetical protein P3T54_08140 [Dehalogenimonas sp.]|uniref:DUF3784 domain-containing protein n=1 Tax=Candidatus Dehalogenimonas loeffleri TaxID=3127115 RepID=A0ABZ2JA60_9CHLR|nr:hypothetical protein [Dehalogenimonas sp.]